MFVEYLFVLILCAKNNIEYFLSIQNVTLSSSDLLSACNDNNISDKLHRWMRVAVPLLLPLSTTTEYCAKLCNGSLIDVVEAFRQLHAREHAANNATSSAELWNAVGDEIIASKRASSNDALHTLSRYW